MKSSSTFKKRIKQILYKILGYLMYYFLSCLFFTIKISKHADPEYKSQEQYVYSFWHGKLLLPITVFSRIKRGISGLVSQSAIGDILSSYIKKQKLELVRGSSTRGAISGVKALISCAKRGRHLGLAPDGPRGPRLKASMGLIYLAYKTGLPIIPLGVAYSKKITITSSWDHFNFPLPFSRAVIYAGKPMKVVDKNNFQHYLTDLHQAMQQAEDMATEMLAMDRQTSSEF